MIKKKLFNPLTAAGLYSHFISHAKLKKICKFINSLQLCVDYIYKVKFYLLNTTLIYKYILHNIVENK